MVTRQEITHAFLKQSELLWLLFGQIRSFANILTQIEEGIRLPDVTVDEFIIALDQRGTGIKSWQGGVFRPDVRGMEEQGALV